MEDHSTEIQIFFFGSALLLGVEAMKTERWRGYVFWGLTVLFLAGGCFWSFIRDLSPAVTAFITAIATNPESWFILAVLGLILLIASGRKKTVGLPQLSAPSEAVEGWQRGADSRFEGIQGLLGQIVERLVRLEGDVIKHNAEIAESLRRHELSPSMGEILSIQSELRSFSEKLKAIDLDHQYLLYFAGYCSQALLLDGLISAAPKSDGRGFLSLPDVVSREAQFGILQSYTRAALGKLQGSDRYAIANQLLRSAEGEAEEELRKIPQEERHPEIDPLDQRRYLIADWQCRKLKVYLRHELDEVIGLLKSERGKLLERAHAAAARRLVLNSQFTNPNSL